MQECADGVLADPEVAADAPAAVTPYGRSDQYLALSLGQGSDSDENLACAVAPLEHDIWRFAAREVLIQRLVMVIGSLLGVDGCVACDAVKPGPDLKDDSVLCELVPQAEEGLLNNVFRLLRTQQAAAVPTERRLVALDKHAKRILVAICGEMRQMAVRLLVKKRVATPRSRFDSFHALPQFAVPGASLSALHLAVKREIDHVNKIPPFHLDLPHRGRGPSSATPGMARGSPPIACVLDEQRAKQLPFETPTRRRATT
ncbi:MAG: hypothetical protein NVSMB51_12770 [Solirubrobacteraceae bacterium]